MSCKKRGFTLVEIGAAMSVAGTMAIVGAQETQFESTQLKARALGNEVFQYNASVSRYLADHAATPEDIGTGVTSSVSVDMDGTEWLKSSCPDGSGTATESYLSCNYLPEDVSTHFYLKPSTTISMNADGGLEARTVWNPTSGVPEDNSAAMGIAALIASGNHISQTEEGSSSPQGPTLFCPDMTTFASHISDFCDTDRGRIVSVHNVNSTIEPWLRTDHGNTMNHVIDFSDDPLDQASIDGVDDGASVGADWAGAGMRQIINVARIYNIGSGSDSLILGKREGSSIYSDSLLTGNNLLDNSVIVDGNAAVMNEFYVKSNAFFSGVIDATGNISSDADISAGNDLIANNNVVAGNNVLADSNIRAIGEVSAGNSSIILRANGDVEATRLLDNSDGNTTEPSAGGYGMNPTDHTRLNRLHIHGQADFYAGTRVNIHNELRIVKASSIGGSCAANGLVGRASSGTLLSCEGGTWTVPGQPGMYSYFNKTSCPPGWVKANGGNGTKDLRGEFIRSWDNGRGVDSGRSLGSWQQYMVQKHRHKIKGGEDHVKAGTGSQTTAPYLTDDDPEGHWVNPKSIGYTGGKETRPRNVALLACMKK